MLQQQQVGADNEFFDLVDDAVSKSSIHPDNNNNSFDKCDLDDEQGIQRPFTPSEGHNSQEEDKQTNVFPMEHEQCPNCKRKFFKGRLTLHLKSCTSEKPLKIKFPSKQKDKEETIPETNTTPKKTDGQKWKVEHDKMLSNLKAIKDKEMIFCQYCQRRFAAHIAERHIPKCKNIFNRPQPPKNKQQQQQESAKPGFKALEKYSQYIGNLFLFINLLKVHPSMKNRKKLMIHNIRIRISSEILNNHSIRPRDPSFVSLFYSIPNLDASRFSQSQQKDTSPNPSQTAFLPKIQTKAFQLQSSEFHVPLLSRSTPAIQCPNCHRSFDQRAGERHIPICEKVMSRQKMISGGNDTKNKRQKKISIQELSPQHATNLMSFNEGNQFCTNCGGRFANNHKYCGNCGKKRS